MPKIKCRFIRESKYLHQVSKIITIRQQVQIWHQVPVLSINSKFNTIQLEAAFLKPKIVKEGILLCKKA
jgi:hypothetical protein